MVLFLDINIFITILSLSLILLTKISSQENYKFPTSGIQPSYFKLKDFQAKYAILGEQLTLEDNSIDYIICEEGIEHIPNQLAVLEEFNRVLKMSGQMLITTPSNSHIRARLSQFI